MNVTDHSHRPRFGCKGPQAQVWLSDLGFSVPPGINSWCVSSEDVLVARLTASEFLLEALGEDKMRVCAAAAILAFAATTPEGVYPTGREDAVMGLAGADTTSSLLEVCAVRLGELASTCVRTEGLLALTSMAGVAVVAIPYFSAAEIGFTIWCDPSYGRYLHDTLASLSKPSTPSPGLASERRSPQ